MPFEHILYTKNEWDEKQRRKINDKLMIFIFILAILSIIIYVIMNPQTTTSSQSTTKSSNQFNPTQAADYSNKVYCLACPPSGTPEYAIYGCNPIYVSSRAECDHINYKDRYYCAVCTANSGCKYMYTNTKEECDAQVY